MSRTILCVTMLGVVVVAAQAGSPVAHPYMLWTKDEAAAIRKRVETDPIAKQQYERMKQSEQAAKSNFGLALLDLFDYAVMGDKAAGERQKKAVLGFVGAKPPGSAGGDPETGNAPWRDDRTIDGLRYDTVYDLLTGEQRTAVEGNIRCYIDWFRKNPGPLARPGLPRTGWLPNMQWTTASGIHVLAAATGDEKNVRDVFEAVGGFKWFMDNYVADGRFYMEEFGKYYSNIGALIFYCEGLRRLGLDRYGWAYTGAPAKESGKVGGATMDNYLNMLIYAGMPRVTRASGTPDYPAVTMGDAGGAGIVNGYWPGQAAGKEGKWTGGTARWGGGRMNGSMHRMLQALWWEAGHRRFPEAGYDYFLAQMRLPDENVHLPTLYFGLGPIGPAKVKPPTVKSFVAPERGFALLRAEESPAYWESPKPAVSLQFGMYYVHYVHDCFSLLQFIANNRLLYGRMGYVGGGYAGGDLCRDSVRGQGSGVVVDCLQIQPVDDGEHGIANERLRHRIEGPAKFVAIRAAGAGGKGLYPDVDMERALVLTDEYLLDAFWLKDAGGKARQFDWHVNAFGVHDLRDARWARSGDLDGGKFWDPRMAAGKAAPNLTNVRKMGLGESEGVAEDILAGKAGGVRVSMLAEKATNLYSFALPGVDPNHCATLMVRRTAPATTFAALHEPISGGADSSRIAKFERIAQSDVAVAAAVIGKPGSGIDDRVLVRLGDEHDKPATVEGRGESFTFADFGYVRVGKDKIVVCGDLKAMKLKVAGEPKLIVNGKETPATVSGGVMELK